MPIGMPNHGDKSNLYESKRNRIGAEAEERRVAKRNQPRVAGEDVPGDPIIAQTGTKVSISW